LLPSKSSRPGSLGDIVLLHGIARQHANFSISPPI
ncbi:hypothetical protein H5410_031207, partial [Solanum commersonii]